MIGAVVGVQPFGGEGLSGTGSEGRRAALSAALLRRADADDQHRRGGRQRRADDARAAVDCASWHPRPSSRSSAAATWPAPSSAGCSSGRPSAAVAARRRAAHRGPRVAAPHVGVPVLAAADRSLADAALVVWAVKPQAFADAAAAGRAACARRLQLTRDGGHPQRHDRCGQRQRARRARDAQHAGVDRPGHRRAVRACRGHRGRPCRRRVGARADRSTAVGRSRGGPRRGDRAVGLRARRTSSTSSRR